MKTLHELGKIYEQVVGYDISTEIKDPSEIVTIMKEWDDESEASEGEREFQKQKAY